MLVIGAGGHAKEVLEIIRDGNLEKELLFFDNISLNGESNFYSYPILKNFQQVTNLFQKNKDFVLALGGTNVRFYLAERLTALGGNLLSIISDKAVVSEISYIGIGANIMPYSGIFGNSILKEGVLVNSFSSVHHDVEIGKFSELSPGCRILGGCKIGEFCVIGSNAVLLPNIRITNQVIIGAGSVVTKNIEEKGVYVGSPARKIK